MNTGTISLVFEDFARIAQRATLAPCAGEVATSERKPTLRIALLYREQIRLPSSTGWLLRVLSGKAWVSFDGQDSFPASGDCLAVPRAGNGGIVSAMGNEALLLEATRV
jgi:hypothetical protein